MTAISQPAIRPGQTGNARQRGFAAIAAVAMLLALSTLPVLAAADLPADRQGTLAVIFPPGTDKAVALTAVAEAEGLVVRGGGWGSVLVAHSDRAGFAGRLRRAGAWLVVDPQTAAGCLFAGTTNSSY